MDLNDLAGLAHLATQAHQNTGGDVGVIGEAGEHPLKLDVVLAPGRDAATPFVGDGEDTVDVGELPPPLAVAEPIGDGPGRAGRAIDRADDGHIVSRPDPAVVPQIAAKRPGVGLRQSRAGLRGVGEVAREQVGLDVVDMDPRAAGDRLRCEPDDLAILADGLARRDVDHRHLVAQRDRLADLDRPIAQVECEPLGDRPGGDRHVVVRPQQNRPPGLGRRRHGSLTPFDRFLRESIQSKTTGRV